jgi:hypothetical protein
MIEPPPADHVRDHPAAHEESAADIGGEDLVPSGEVEVEHRGRGITHGRAAHEDVEAAEGLRRALDRGLGVGFSGDVAGDRNRALPREARRLLGALQVDVEAGDFRAGLGEGDRDRAADAAAGAGDDCGLAAELVHHFLPR